jgi:hypothetical protein
MWFSHLARKRKLAKRAVRPWCPPDELSVGHGEGNGVRGNIGDSGVLTRILWSNRVRQQPECVRELTWGATVDCQKIMTVSVPTNLNPVSERLNSRMFPSFWHDRSKLFRLLSLRARFRTQHLSHWSRFQTNSSQIYCFRYKFIPKRTSKAMTCLRHPSQVWGVMQGQSS